MKGPEKPEERATAAQGEEEGEAEVSVPEEEGAAQAAMEMEESGMGDSVFSFLFLSCSWRMFLVFLASGGPWGEGVSGHLTITAQAGSG